MPFLRLFRHLRSQMQDEQCLTIFHLIGISACCKCHQLMSKTDCKNRNIGIVKFLYFFNNRSAFFRVSRAIAEHDSVWMISKDLLCRCKSRVNSYLTSALIQGTISFSRQVTFSTTLPVVYAFNLGRIAFKS